MNSLGLRLRERSLQLILCALCYQALIFFVVRVFPPPRLNCSQFWITSWADHGYVLGNSRAPAEKKKNRKKIEARFTLYTTSQPGTKNMTELFDEWVIEPVWAIPKNRFLACFLSFKTRPGFENNLSHARMVQLVFLLLGDITSLYRLKTYSISYEIYRGYYIAARGYEFYLRARKVYFQHKKIKFVSPSGHVMFCLFYRYWWNSYIKNNFLKLLQFL